MSTTALALAQMASVRHAIDRISTSRAVLIGWHDPNYRCECFDFKSDAECAAAAEFAASTGCEEVMLATTHSFWSPNLATPSLCHDEEAMSMQPITLHVIAGLRADGEERGVPTRFNPDHIIRYCAELNVKGEAVGTRITGTVDSVSVQELPEEIDYRLYGLIARDGAGTPLVAVREARASW